MVDMFLNNLTFYSYEARITYKYSYAVIHSAKKIVTSISRQRVRSQSTAATQNQFETTESSWRSYVRRWQWKIPLGLSISLLAVLQWRYFRKRHETRKGPIEGLMVIQSCVCKRNYIFIY
jgi:sensor c-di-GMP phosphodiesterase-like protein